MKFIIQASGEMLESNAGLLLAGKILAGLDLDRRANGMAIDKMLEPRIKNADVIRSYFGLLVLGRTAFEDIELFRASGYFRRALGIKRVIGLYHAHGASEQFHGELKSDMDVERLPSGKFKIPTLREVGTTVLQAAMMAFNALRRIGQGLVMMKDRLGLTMEVQRLRLRSVLRDIMYLACKYVERRRQYFLKFSRNSRWLLAAQCLYARL